jgi:hypothetical protein
MESIKFDYPDEDKATYEALFGRIGELIVGSIDSEVSIGRRRQPWKDTAAYEMAVVVKEKNGYSVVCTIGYRDKKLEGLSRNFDEPPVKKVARFENKPTKEQVEKLLFDLGCENDFPL